MLRCGRGPDRASFSILLLTRVISTVRLAAGASTVDYINFATGFSFPTFTRSFAHQLSSFVAKESAGRSGLGRHQDEERALDLGLILRSTATGRRGERGETVQQEGKEDPRATAHDGEHRSSHNNIHSARELHSRHGAVPNMARRHLSFRARPAGIDVRLLPGRLQCSRALAVLLAGSVSRWVHDGVLELRSGVCYRDRDGVYVLSDVRETSSLVADWQDS